MPAIIPQRRPATATGCVKSILRGLDGGSVESGRPIGSTTTNRKCAACSPPTRRRWQRSVPGRSLHGAAILTRIYRATSLGPVLHPVGLIPLRDDTPRPVYGSTTPLTSTRTKNWSQLPDGLSQTGYSERMPSYSKKSSTNCPSDGAVRASRRQSIQLSIPLVSGECRRSGWASSATATSMLWQVNHSRFTKWGSVGSHRG